MLLKQSPFDYLKFRINAFLYLLRDPYSPPYNYFYTGHFNKEELTKTKNFLITNFENYIKLSAKVAPFFFKPYFWLILSIFSILLTFFLKLNIHNKIMIRCIMTWSFIYVRILTCNTNCRFKIYILEFNCGNIRNYKNIDFIEI